MERHNLSRLREDWSSTELGYQTCASIVRLCCPEFSTPDFYVLTRFQRCHTNPEKIMLETTASGKHKYYEITAFI